MKMTQAVKSGVLTIPRVNCKHLSKRLKKYVLQFQILATSLSIPIPTMPVVAQ